MGGKPPFSQWANDRPACPRALAFPGCPHPLLLLAKKPSVIVTPARNGYTVSMWFEAWLRHLQDLLLFFGVLGSPTHRECSQTNESAEEKDWEFRLEKGPKVIATGTRSLILLTRCLSPELWQVALSSWASAPHL